MNQDAVSTLMTMLSRQEVILPGHKALVQDGTLYNDHIYKTTGNVGRWAMNTFFRPVTSTARRRDVCTHVDWLVTQLGAMVDVDGSSDGHNHVLFEYHVGRLLQTISSLMQMYPLDNGAEQLIEQQWSNNDGGKPAYTVLEACMVRLLDLKNTKDSITIVDTRQIHV